MNSIEFNPAFCDKDMKIVWACGGNHFSGMLYTFLYRELMKHLQEPISSSHVEGLCDKKVSTVDGKLNFYFRCSASYVLKSKVGKEWFFGSNKSEHGQAQIINRAFTALVTAGFLDGIDISEHKLKDKDRSRWYAIRGIEIELDKLKNPSIKNFDFESVFLEALAKREASKTISEVNSIDR